MTFLRLVPTLLVLLSCCAPLAAQPFTVVELNCENLMDTAHDEGKADQEYLPTSTRHWTRSRYWRKLNHIGREILSCCDDGIPDLVALCEVENDSVLHYLTRRSLLRGAGYSYLVTSSPDVRGIDVALLYSPFSFRPLRSYPIRVEPVAHMRPTRDILYAAGLTMGGDTLHVFVVHAPSRYGGERYSRPFRMAVARRLCQSVDSIGALSAAPHILITGDFNDDADAPALQAIAGHNLHNISRTASGQNGARGTYRYQGRWGSIDHILCSPPLAQRLDTVFIHAPLFLLEPDRQHGGYRPQRTYQGMRYQPGYSDHLPLVARFRL